MNQPHVVLEKERDFSEVFNASFSFITQEIKGLLKMLLYFGGIPILAIVVVSAFYTQNFLESFLSAIQGGNTGFAALPNPFMTLVVLLLSIFVYLVLAGLTAAYMGVYLKQGAGGFTMTDVWNLFARKLGPIVGYSLIAGILMFFGFLFFLIPGIFLSVPFSLVIMIVVVEDKSFGETLSRCFRLVKSNWWITFAILIVAYMIISVLSVLFSMPAAIIGAVKGFLTATGNDPGNINSTGVVLATVVGELGSYLMYPIFFVVTGMQYFNLKERKDMGSLHQKVDAISEE